MMTSRRFLALETDAWDSGKKIPGGIDFDHVLTVLIWGLVKTYGAFGEEHASYVDEKSTRFFLVISKHTWDDVGLNSYDSLIIEGYERRLFLYVSVYICIQIINKMVGVVGNV